MYGDGRRGLIQRRRRSRLRAPSSGLELTDGSRVGVIGGGPAGSFFSHFLLDLAERVGLNIHVDIYEPRDFSRPGPAGCNHCGGIVSESLVQNLAAEGIILPPSVVQRGIDSYTLHTGVGSIRIATPLEEKRIAAVFRGSGPRGVEMGDFESFDAHLQALAVEKGAHLVHQRVAEIAWEDGRPRITTKSGASQTYDLVAAALGVNTASLKIFDALGIEYGPPETTKTYITEIPMERDRIRSHLGYSMHILLFDIPRLEFAALIPKAEHVTLCLLGEEIDDLLIQRLLEIPEVRKHLPEEQTARRGLCHCSPRICTRGAVRPYADRVVFVGDCGVTRLYKDGIGAAYRTAKAAATTAVLHGIAAGDFREHFWPVCRSIETDNSIGRLIFAVTRRIQRRRFACRGLLRMIAHEQARSGRAPRMSTVLWDTFTGSAPYREVLLRTLHPLFLLRFLWDLSASVFARRSSIQ